MGAIIGGILQGGAAAGGGGSGDVVGPASSTDGTVALNDGTTGKLLKEGPVLSAFAATILDDADAATVRATIGATGTIGGTLGATDNRIPRSDGTGGSTLQLGLTTEDDSGNVTTTGHLAVGKRLKGKQGADIASDTNITLGDGNFFFITGTTAINTISTAGWPSGSVVVFQFAESVTMTHVGAGDFSSLALAGAANFSATAGDTLMLVYDGAIGDVWREIARTVI